MIGKPLLILLLTISCSVGLAQEGRDIKPTLKRDMALGAVDAFEKALEERWSYRRANRSDFGRSITKLRRKIETGITQDQLGVEFQEIIALGIDGHSGVSGFQLPAGRRLPFLLEAASGGRFVAFRPDRSGFLAEGLPFITKIDGRSVKDWCSAAARLVPKGSLQYVRYRSLLQIRELDYWRARMGLPVKDTVDVELSNVDGNLRKKITIRTAESLPLYGTWPSFGSRLLEHDIGYLRLPSMITPSSVEEIKRWMPEFRGTDGLVVDVRDNNGGDRDALVALYSYLVPPDALPRVFNVAAYRLHVAHKDNYLAENHRMFRISSNEWTLLERREVEKFARSFEPKWRLPRGQFSDWHFSVLSPIDDPHVFFYSRPVIVLMNAKCFSATDIFLAGLKGVKNVVLLGEASSGGSAYSREIPLGTTQLRLRIGTMVSFQADGSLFDGNGVQPDVVLASVPEHYIGGRDNVLEEALARIRRSKIH